jgi:hypothetical protein
MVVRRFGRLLFCFLFLYDSMQVVTKNSKNQTGCVLQHFLKLLNFLNLQAKEINPIF